MFIIERLLRSTFVDILKKIQKRILIYFGKYEFGLVFSK